MGLGNHQNDADENRYCILTFVGRIKDGEFTESGADFYDP